MEQTPFIKHLIAKYPDLDITTIIPIIIEEVSKIQTSAPESTKVPLGSDLIKDLFCGVLNSLLHPAESSKEENQPELDPIEQHTIDNYFKNQIKIENKALEGTGKCINEDRLLEQLIAADETTIRMTTTFIKDSQYNLQHYKSRLNTLIAIKKKRDATA